MDQAYKSLLEKQGYRFTGDHSSIKICEWTKKSITGQGECYKQKFYGIKSHQCCQVSVATNFCDLDCMYCWRQRNNSPFTKIDDPKTVIENSIKAQKKLLEGYYGNAKASKKLLDEAQNPTNFAISLTGEMLYYPKLGEFISELHKKGCWTFLVTNGMLPEVMANLEPQPTQLYISLDSPTPEMFEELDKPIRKDAWEKLMKSLDVMKTLKKRTRTTLRLTLIKGINMVYPEKYADLFERADPKFIEVKAYSWVGASRERLAKKNMPLHEDVRKFAEEICKHCKYKIIDESTPSRVVLLMKKDIKDRFLKRK